MTVYIDEVFMVNLIMVGWYYGLLHVCCQLPAIGGD